jgi:hypothetical protein
MRRAELSPKQTTGAVFYPMRRAELSPKQTTGAVFIYYLISIILSNAPCRAFAEVNYGYSLYLLFNFYHSIQCAVLSFRRSKFRVHENFEIQIKVKTLCSAKVKF